MGKLKNIAVGTAMAGASLAPVGEVKGQIIREPEDPIVIPTELNQKRMDASIGAEFKLTHIRRGPLSLSNTVGVHARPMRPNFQWIDQYHGEGFLDIETPSSVGSLGIGAEYRLNQGNKISAGFDIQVGASYLRHKVSAGTTQSLFGSSGLSAYAGVFSETQNARGSSILHNVRRGIDLGLEYQLPLGKDVNASARIGYSHGFDKLAVVNDPNQRDYNLSKQTHILGPNRGLSFAVGLNYTIPSPDAIDFEMPKMSRGSKSKKVKRTRVKNPQTPCYSHQRKSHYRESGIFNHPNR